MPRTRKSRISRFESFIDDNSRPIPYLLVPRHHTSISNSDPATRLLDLLTPIDLLRLRLVSNQTYTWTNQQVGDTFATLGYTVSIDEQRGHLITYPATLTSLKTIGRLCRHLTITILSSPNISSPSFSSGHVPTNTTTTDPFPQLLAQTPNLSTLTISLPLPSSSRRQATTWRLYPMTHATLLNIRQALESQPSSSIKQLQTLRLHPISLSNLVSLRWHGLAAYGDASWMGTSFWNGVRRLRVGVYVPFSCVDVSSPTASASASVKGRSWDSHRDAGGVDPGDEHEERAERESQEAHIRMGIKVLHDWLGSFAEGLEELTFEWLMPPLALPSQSESEAFVKARDRSPYTTTHAGPSYNKEQEQRRDRSGGSWTRHNWRAHAFSPPSSSLLSGFSSNDDNDDYDDDHNDEARTKPTDTNPASTKGPNPLTLHLNPTPFAFHVPSAGPTTDSDFNTFTPLITRPIHTSSRRRRRSSQGQGRESQFSAPAIRWKALREVWLRNVYPHGCGIGMRTRSGNGEGGEDGGVDDLDGMWIDGVAGPMIERVFVWVDGVDSVWTGGAAGAGVRRGRGRGRGRGGDVLLDAHVDIDADVRGHTRIHPEGEGKGKYILLDAFALRPQPRPHTQDPEQRERLSFPFVEPEPEHESGPKPGPTFTLLPPTRTIPPTHTHHTPFASPYDAYSHNHFQDFDYDYIDPYGSRYFHRDGDGDEQGGEGGEGVEQGLRRLRLGREVGDALEGASLESGSGVGS